MMLMLHSLALSLTLAAQLPGDSGNTFCFLTNQPAAEYHLAEPNLQLIQTHLLAIRLFTRCVISLG